MKDYYSILGVSESSTQEEIKKAYKKLAMRYHPDKNSETGAEERFKQIAEAYDTLGNLDKKSKYDLNKKYSPYGNSHFGPNERAWKDKKSGFSFDEYVKSKSNRFKNSNFGKGKDFGSEFVKPSTEYLDINISETLELKDAILGVKIEFEFDRYKLSSTFEKEKEAKKILIDIDLTKKYLNLIKENEKFYIKAKISTFGNEDIHNRLNAWGDNISTPLFGDLHIKIFINLPENINIEETNIIQYVSIPLTKVIFKGEKVRIETFNDKVYDAEITKPLKLNDLKFIIKNNGLLGSNGIPGDYIIRFDIISPDVSKLSIDQKDSLRDLLSSI